MKLYLNESQRVYLLEILKSSEKNAVDGKDLELAEAFKELYEKIKPENASYINLKRDEAETIFEFCEIVRQSLDKAISFLDKDSDKSEEEKLELKEKAVNARKEIELISTEINEKIRNNPL
jgi:Na+/phosphate symporter